MTRFCTPGTTERATKILRLARVLLLGVLVSAWSANALAATCNSTGSGTWNAAARWSCGHVPLAADDVFVLNTHTVTIDTAAVAQNVTVNTGSILRFATTTARSLVVANAGAQGNITIQTGATFDVDTASNVTHTLSLVGNLVNNGTLNLARDANSLCNATFNRNGNQTISGTGASTVFNAVIVDMGAARANTLDVQLASFTLSTTGYVDINNGTFEISANVATIAPFDNAPKAATPDFYVIPPTGGFWLNSATTVNIATVTSYNVSTDGLFRVSAGIVNLGRAADDRLRIRPTAGNTALVQMDGGAMNITGRLTSVNVADNGVFTQSGGTITTGTIGNAIATFGAFFLGSASTFNMSGGTLIVQNISTGAGAGNNDYDVRSPTSTVTGGLVQIGSAASTAGQTFEVNSVAPVWDFTVNNTRTPTALLNSTLTVRDDLTIGTGATLNANNQAISVGSGNSSGAWTNNGTFTPGTGTVTFTGTSASSTIGGATATTFRGLTINKASNDVTVATSPTISTTLTLTSGNIVTGGNRVILATVATVVTPSAASYVFGTVQKNYAAAGTFLFPVGDANNYAPVTIQGTAGFTAGSLSINTTGTDHPQVTTPIPSTGIDATQSVNRYWSLVASGLPATSVYTATFSFIGGVPVDLDAGATPASFVVQRYDGANWNPTTLGTAGATSTSITGVANLYGDFAIGEPIANFNGSPGAFNSFETTTPAGSVLGRIYTKLVSNAFQVSIVAVSNNAVNTTPLTTALTVEIIDASSTGGTFTAATNCRSTWTSVQSQTVPAAVGWVAGRVIVTINAATRAVRNARIRVTQGALIGCSTDNFAVRPASFTVTSTNATQTSTSGLPAIKTGANFNLSATSASNYDGTPAVDGSKVTGTPTAGTLGGSFSAATLLTGWVASGTTFFYSEVGHIGLLADAVVDSGFTSVDQTTDCVASSTSITLASGKYGCSIGSTAVPFSAGISGFGRFIPDNFAVSLNTPVLGTACAAGAPGTFTSFTYVGQPIGYITPPVMTVTARSGTNNSLTNATTVNYSGVPGATYVKLTNSSLTPVNQGSPAVLPWRYTRFDALGGGTTPQINTGNLPSTTSDPTVSNFVSGVGTLTFSSGAGLFFTRSSTTPTAPFNADIALSVNVIDGDNVQYGSNPVAFGAATSGNGIPFTTGAAKEMRYGRMRLNNSFGSSTLDMALGLSIESYTSAGIFTINTAESCTTLTATNIRMSAVGTPDLVTACKTSLNPAGTIYFSGGIASAAIPSLPVVPVKLTKPSLGSNGTLDLTINLGGASSGTTCTPASSAVTSAAKPWLQGNWGTTSYTADPVGRATFGLFRSADEFIYLREVY